jgi:hypothetical protein
MRDKADARILGSYTMGILEEPYIRSKKGFQI